MQIHKFSMYELPQFGALAKLLGKEQERLLPLIDLPFNPDNFQHQIQKKADFAQNQRDVLVEAIQKQYTECGLEAPINLSNLKKTNCFTICTGHQLNLFTGPLYTIYKIAHTIKLAEQLNQLYPEQSFEPIFWMATEDHDFEEINHFNSASKTFQWKPENASAALKGAVGRYPLDDWQNWQDELLQLLPFHKTKIQELLECYKGKKLAQATRQLFHFLFRDTKLLIIDGDDVLLKRSFAPVMEKEIEERFALQASQISAKQLEKKKLKEQAFVRDINLFCLENNKRARLEWFENYITIDGVSYTKSEVIEKLRNHPEKFSPNVILRPLYQETVLPNLCYIGGSGELAYWLQLKPIFEAAGIPYPLLKLRFSGQTMSSKQVDKMEKFGFNFPSFSKPKQEVIQDFVVRKSTRNTEKDQATVRQLLDNMRTELLRQAKSVDTTLIAAADAKIQSIENLIKAFEEKLARNERKLHRDSIERLTALHEALFPNGILQERQENFIVAYLETNGKFIELLLNNLNAFEDDFLVFEL